MLSWSETTKIQNLKSLKIDTQKFCDGDDMSKTTYFILIILLIFCTEMNCSFSSIFIVVENMMSCENIHAREICSPWEQRRSQLTWKESD